MSVRGLPKGQWNRSGGVVALPTYGTVEYIDGYGTTGKSPTISSMDSDEFTILVSGVSSNSYMYSDGYNENDLEVRQLQEHHNGNGWESVHQTYLAPLPGDELTHGTTVNLAFGSNDSPAWCRARFRKLPGFQGLMVASHRVSQNTQVDTFSITPFTNPMTEPGGLCITGAFKDYTGYPTTVTGTGWNKGGNGGLTIQGYYILSTTEIETPPVMSFTGGGTGRYWAGMVTYLR